MKRRTRIKICGLTRVEDVQACVQSGVDAIGLVFVEQSPRNLTLEQGAALRAEIPAFVQVVALLMNPQAGQVEALLRQVQPDLLQFHGQETAAFCKQWRRGYLKAIAMKNRPMAEIEAEIAQHHQARGLLLDAHAPGEQGGSGQRFDWNHLPDVPRERLILAGGLRPDNIRAAIAQVRPGAVDLSSGVEQAPGIKSPEKIQQLVQQVRQADQECA